MTALHCCPHGRARLRQRGFRGNDHELIYLLGVQVDDQEIFIPEVVVAYEIAVRQHRIGSIERRTIVGNAGSKYDEISSLKREIHQLERLPNRKIVHDKDVLITGYRPSRRGQRRCIRRLRDKAFRLHKGR